MTTKDDDKGESKNISSESRTSQEFKNQEEFKTQEESLESRIKIQDSRSQESRPRFKTQDSRMKKRLNQDKY